MAADSFTFKIITPAGLTCEEHVTSVTLPSPKGEIGVLPEHVGYTGLLTTGVVEYVPVELGLAQRAAIGGGLCIYSEETLVVLADSVETPESVNKETYAAERNNLLKTVQEGSAYDPAWETAREKLARIEAVDRIIKG